MIQTVGKVKLNYKFYNGVDAYSDGDVENRLLDIVENNEKDQFNRIIAKTKDWTILYHLSHIRGNIVRGMDIGKEDKVLEIGSGCGAITGELAKRAKTVTCVELSKRRSLINANQNKECDNVEILVGNFQAIEPHLEEQYDVITLNGVFEYANLYIEGENSFHEFLNRIAAHLTPGGRLIVAIENKFGLKYWAGCQEDHIGGYFSGLEGYEKEDNGIRTFSKKELEEIFREVGFVHQEFYYPYPDYKFPMAIYTDEYLPKPGELTINMQNFDRDRLSLFQEEKVYNEIIREDMYPFFANSYLVVLSKEKIEHKEKTIFTKFSNERDTKFAIKTEIDKDQKVGKVVKKVPVHHDAGQHVSNMLLWQEQLEAVYKDTNLSPCPCKKDGEGVSFDFADGVSLEEVLDNYLDEKKYEDLFQTIETYFQMCKKAATEDFVITEEFVQMFGDIQLPSGLKCCSLNNVDMVFGNIILKDKDWTILDYEWCFPFPIPVDFILYRELHYYVYLQTKRRGLLDKDIFGLLGDSKDLIPVFEEMEKQFQKYIQGSLVPVRELYQDMGCRVYHANSLVKEAFIEFDRSKIRIYKDQGTGFSEETSVCMAASQENKVYRLCIPVEEGTKALRIDPMEHPCFLRLHHIWALKEKERYDINAQCRYNGEITNEGAICFATYDPWILLNLESGAIQEIEIEFSIESIDSQKRREIDLSFPQRVEMANRISRMEMSNATLEKELAECKNQLELMRSSISWKLTKPIRCLKRVLKKCKD